ncbi:uncharacterized protein LOC133515494 [Cydia pomonella]|uniref:uncharacterized protein LOC133515494 n=1 Tax=Cydia pomonella TaxID=82600 RepID=UPI002ADD8EB9|nr:uncharacterized protein LOC133515494 [Cydia pomonella]
MAIEVLQQWKHSYQAFQPLRLGLEDNAILEGLPLILQDDAAVWWQGVKHEIDTWEEFEIRLRHAYAPKKPTYAILQDIIEIKQDKNTPTEIFIQKKRALIAQLPPPRLTEQFEIDMIFGQLRFEVRDKINRDTVTTFKELSEKARHVERSLSERAAKMEKPVTSHSTKLKSRCNSCRIRGHTADVCRKQLLPRNEVNEQATDKSQAGPKANQSATASVTPLVPAKPKFKCYGCGEPGVVRSRCPKCNIEKVKLEEICSINLSGTHRRPTVPIKIDNIESIGHVDTCAKFSVCSYQLYRRLSDEGYKFKQERRYITLADGVPKMQDVHTITVPICVYGKTVPTLLVVLPGPSNTKTYLGVDYITDSLMVVNIPQLTFRFLDEPSKVFDLIQEDIGETLISQIVSDLALPELLSPLLSPTLSIPEKCMTPKQSTSMTEMSLERPYGPSFSIGLTVSPKMAVKRQLEPQLADEASSTSAQSMSISQLPPERIRKSYGPLIPIELRTPPKRQRNVLLDGYSPIIDALKQDAMRAFQEDDIKLSPVSRNLFGSRSTDIASIDIAERVLSSEEDKQLNELISQHEDIFIPNGKPTTQTEHVIDTGSHRPISVPPYRLPPAKTEILKEKSVKCLKRG